jgi:hypothetical protein
MALKLGILKKRGRKGGFKDRFFELTELDLQYHGSKAAFSDDPKGIKRIKLHEIEKIMSRDQSSQFQLFTRKKPYQFLARTVEDKNEWVAAINSACDRFRTTSPRATRRGKDAPMGFGGKDNRGMVDDVTAKFGHNRFDAPAYVAEFFAQTDMSQAKPHCDELRVSQTLVKDELKREVCR